ncbi:MAG: DUF6179 domain-containing protein [Bacillota bacterium]
MNENVFSLSVDETLTEAEAHAVQEKLLGLLARRAALYTGGDSSSVRVETARALLEGVAFCLELTFAEDGGTLKSLLTGDAEALLARGQALCARKIARGRALYARACQTAPELGSVALWDTLSGLAGFFRRYDYRFFAQEIPCVIDYPLATPVDEGLQGVSYVNEYLRRLLMENAFLSRFTPERIARLLARALGDYRELPLNLFGPVCANAAGLALLDEDLRALDIPPLALGQLETLFKEASVETVKRLLAEGAERACAALGLREPALAAYVCAAACALHPYIEVALLHGNLGNVFIAFGD